MVARLPALPDGYFQCQWCRGGVRFLPDGSWPSRCPHCEMHPHPGKVDETVGGKVDPDKAKAAARNRRGDARQQPLRLTPIGQPVLGVDPGARYTGIVLRDGDAVLHATTLVRSDDQDPVEWARFCKREVARILFSVCPAGTKMGIEGVAVPKGFKNGQKAPINPGPILHAGLVLGAIVGEWEDAVEIPPGGNGSQHVTHYPPALVGRRPDDLPGSSNKAGTRDHEQSAYDVAGKAAKILYPSRKGLDGLR